MSKYPEYKQLDLTAIDREILAFWEEHQIFEKSVDQRPEDRRFVFYEGPPSANGKPGIHHVMARTIKDLFCRYHTLKGERVERKGGWDTHGLPIELNVEKELGITKEDIGTTISIADYNAKCRETVMRYKDLWDDITRKMGYWVDLDHPYITYDSTYIESVWWLLKQLYDKGLMYKGYTIQPYSPAAGTGLSSHELNMPGTYRDVTDTSAVAQFKVVRNEKSEFLFPDADKAWSYHPSSITHHPSVYFLAWTTTPWTLPSNVALAAGAKIDYVLVKTFNPYTFLPVNVILAKELLNKWLKPEQAEVDFDIWKPGDKLIPYRVIGEFKGAQFEYIEYEQLLPYVQPTDGDAFKVLLGDFVSTEEGTGIVHVAPSFGADDMKVGKKYGMGTLTLVDLQGKFVDAVADFAGRYVKDYKDEENYRNVDIDISIKLKEENKAFNVQKFSHNYPHCWRTDKPVLYYPLDSWFIKSTACRERMVELNKTINWKPAHTGEKRFGNWLENLQDWNLSRSRFWGVPLPIWRTGNSQFSIPDSANPNVIEERVEKCIGSIEQLRTEIEKANKKLNLKQSVPDDLHRPFIDDVTLVSDDGRPMTREKDLIDVWFDSGAMPYAQWHYPFENKEIFAKNFPADYIAEGVDQTRGWFFSLHAIATMVFDSVAFKNVVSNGLVQDKEGRKMSKRLGNAPEPFETIAKYGADATRWYMISNASPWDNLKFDPDGITEAQRKVFATVYNTYSFFALYANIDDWMIDEQNVSRIADRPEIDRWIISKLHSLVKDYRTWMDDYDATPACRAIETFVDDHLSNWYVRLNRRRFWKGEMTEDKKMAYETLYECLMVVSQLMAPVAPFFADWMFRNLKAKAEAKAEESKSSITHHPSPIIHPSVHLTDLTIAEDDVIDPALEQRMDYAQRISSLVLSIRKKEQIRVRQPLQRILLPVLDDQFQSLVEQVKDLILSEVNVKAIEYLTDASGILKKKAKPNFKVLGKKLGKHMKDAAAKINELSPAEIATIEKSNQYKLSIDGDTFDLTLEDIEIATEDIPGWQVASDGDLVVALDVTLNDELIAEGYARDLVNRIQNLRKDKGFNVTDRIKVVVSEHMDISKAVSGFGEFIKSETLAQSLEVGDAIEGEIVEWLDGGSIRISAMVV
ncbi:MAG TPA: isoleucine--tRNA ligase [Saprospiraceae bacterium]|nr:isoleucine--tRNA ligase [Saprospiraceae bacterium]